MGRTAQDQLGFGRARQPPRKCGPIGLGRVADPLDELNRQGNGEAFHPVVIRLRSRHVKPARRTRCPHAPIEVGTVAGRRPDPSPYSPQPQPPVNSTALAATQPCHPSRAMKPASTSATTLSAHHQLGTIR